jgi:hypothetical protein
MGTTNQRHIDQRRGAVALESAVVLSAALTLLFVTVILGLAAYRSNILAAAARRVAREAIVHGAKATPERTVWGPTDYTGTAADSTEIAAAAAPLLATMSAADVTVEVTWPDGGNRENDRVHVRLSYRQTLLIPFLSLNNPLDLLGVSTMRVIH